MPHRTSWYIKNKIIHARVWGNQDLEELRESNASLVSLINESPENLGLVHIIMNDNELQSAPISLSALQQTLQFGKHPRLGWTIMIGNSSPALRFVSQMLARIFGIRFHRAASLMDAIAFLKARDGTIPWDNADESVVQTKAKVS